MNRLASVVLMSALLATLSGAWSAPAPAAPALGLSARDLLRQIYMETPANYRGEKTVIFFTTAGSQAVIVQEDRSNGSSRMVYLSSAHKPSRIVVEDARQVMYYQPSTQRVITAARDQAPPDPGRYLSKALVNYRWRITGSGAVAGVPALVLEARRRDGSVAQRLWVNPIHRLVLKKQKFREDGALVFASFFTDIGFVASLPSQIFTVAYPPTATVKQVALPSRVDPALLASAVDFAVVLPVWMPQGYSLDGIYTEEDAQGDRAVRLVYGDGLETLALIQSARAGEWRPLRHAQTVRIDGRPVEKIIALEGTVLHWTDGIRTYTLVGNLPDATLLRMASRIIAAAPTAPPEPSKDLGYYFGKGVTHLWAFFGGH